MSNQSLMFFEEITKWVDDGSPVDVVYLDFQKALNKVPHQRLLFKLKALAIGNDIINWIEKWLTQTVIVDGEISNWKFETVVTVETCDGREYNGAQPLPVYRPKLLRL